MKKCLICDTEHSKRGQCCSKECSNVLRKRTGKETNLKRYGVENVFQLKKVQDKSKQTYLAKYGVEHPLQSEEIRNKSKETCLDRYGVEHNFKSEDIKKQIKQTCFDRYGVEHPLQSEEIRNKSKQTCLERYGVENPLQSEEIQDKVKQTCLERYGVEHLKQSHIPKEFLTQDWWDQRTGFLEAKELIGTHISEANIYLKAHQFRPDWDFKSSISSPHQAIIDYLNQTGIDFTINDRQQIKPYELDIFIPSKNLGIEVDGVYWHSLPKAQKNDPIKTKLCEQKGIKLLRFTDLEVNNEWNQTSNTIKTHLGN